MMIKNMKQNRPLGDRILLRRHKETEQFNNGVVIPDRAREKPQKATVIAIGSERKTDKGVLLTNELKVGDTVMLSQYGGDEVRLGDVTYTLLPEDDILGILTDVAVEATSII